MWGEGWGTTQTAQTPSPWHRGHLLHFVLGVGLPAPALHLGRVQQRVLPDGVGPVARQGVHHLQGGTGRAQWARGGALCVCPHVPTGPAPTWSRVAGQGLWRRCLTMEMWRPRLRCTLQHSSQISTPRLMEAQPGSAGWHGGDAGFPRHPRSPPRAVPSPSTLLLPGRGGGCIAMTTVSQVTARGSAHLQGKPTGFP